MILPEWFHRTLRLPYLLKVHRSGRRGPTVIFLHGLASFGTVWDPAVSMLSRSHRCVIIDLLGHGESAKPMGDYSLGAFASGLRDFLAAIEAEIKRRQFSQFSHFKKWRGDPIGFVADALLGFLWSLKSGQYDDLDGAAWRAIADDEPASDHGRSR